jgi:hypothetical protein
MFYFTRVVNSESLRPKTQIPPHTPQPKPLRPKKIIQKSPCPVAYSTFIHHPGGPPEYHWWALFHLSQTHHLSQSPPTADTLGSHLATDR